MYTSWTLHLSMVNVRTNRIFSNSPFRCSCGESSRLPRISSFWLVVILLVVTMLVQVDVRSVDSDNGGAAGRVRRRHERKTTPAPELPPIFEVPECTPVSHDTLWRRLNLESTASVQLVGSRQSSFDVDSQAIAPIMTAEETNSFPETEDNSPELLDNRATSRGSRHRSARRRRSRKSERPSGGKKHRPKSTDDFTRKDIAQVFRNSSWLCHMETEWLTMDSDTFPPYVQSGRCTQSRCMLGIYECTPRMYSIKVLKRLPNRCHPLPTLGPNATYEEAWVMADFDVTVGCDCSRRLEPGIYTKAASDAQ